ncbi:pyridoxamine 5'-phosphate oxidase family protein [Actinomadura hibisca]|uniref:pyridoxamine 5'-phosphate oxidase family protein n=1 Tax=Actinomadura hibisca TaxID=68565 RepID=UPI000833EA68|nr:pyridoxamine 5'-phosphate oxidase family protein [Actinomadura hibisca]
MATWAEIEKSAPELAEKVRAAFQAGTNKTIATLRKDGSPRISAVEMTFEDGQARFGMMGGSLKLLDVRRDPRVALHCPTLEPPESPSDWPGDAKMAGRAVEVEPPAENAMPGSGYFVLDITEVVHTKVGDPADHLEISTWHPDRGPSTHKRY